MRIGFGQILVLLFILILLFGDIQQLKKKVFSLLTRAKEIMNKK